MYINYQVMEIKISNREDFKGNSAHAKNEIDGYKIYSYATLIYNSKDNFFNTAYYSTTTSRLQGIIAIQLFGKTLKQIRKEKEKNS